MATKWSKHPKAPKIAQPKPPFFPDLTEVTERARRRLPLLTKPIKPKRTAKKPFFTPGPIPPEGERNIMKMPFPKPSPKFSKAKEGAWGRLGNLGLPGKIPRTLSEAKKEVWRKQALLRKQTLSTKPKLSKLGKPSPTKPMLGKPSRRKR